MYGKSTCFPTPKRTHPPRETSLHPVRPTQLAKQPRCTTFIFVPHPCNPAICARHLSASAATTTSTNTGQDGTLAQARAPCTCPVPLPAPLHAAHRRHQLHSMFSPSAGHGGGVVAISAQHTRWKTYVLGSRRCEVVLLTEKWKLACGGRGGNGRAGGREGTGGSAALLCWHVRAADHSRAVQGLSLCSIGGNSVRGSACGA